MEVDISDYTMGGVLSIEYEDRIKFEVWTDYKNLEYFMKVQNLNRRQAH